MTPESREKILRDYRIGKHTSAVKLAEAHGVSRSAVYRVLKAEKAVNQPHDSQGSDEAANDNETHIVDSSSGELIPNDALIKMDALASDLDLPEEGSRLRHDNDDKTPAQREADEKVADELMSRIAGDMGDFGGDAALDGVLGKIYSQPAPPAASRRGGEISRQRATMSYEPPAVIYDRTDLTQRIIFNVEHFSPHLKTIIGDNSEAFIQSLAVRSGEELSALLKTIERTRSIGNLAAGFKQVFYIAGQAVETGSRVIGMKTTGFTQQLREQDEEITMCLKEIAINEWERLKAFDSPQIRLGTLFCMTLMQTDARNRMSEALQKVVNAPVNASVAAANADL